MRGVGLPVARQANAVFPVLPAGATQRLLARFRFYVWSEASGMVRLMCAWDTTEAQVDELVRAVGEELAREEGAGA